MAEPLTLIPLEGLPAIAPGDDLVAHIARAVETCAGGLREGDIVVVCQKVVSKALGRRVRLAQIEPSEFARTVANQWGKDPRVVELVLRQSKRIVRMDRGVIIVETGPGWVCANAGIDESNVMEDGVVLLLPEDPDGAAASLSEGLSAIAGTRIPVLITDTFGRPWRTGLTDVCIGIAGMSPLLDLRGTRDLGGRELHHTVMACGDQLAAAAGLLMEKAAGIPAVLVRGYRFTVGEGSARDLIRRAEEDLFR